MFKTNAAERNRSQIYGENENKIGINFYSESIICHLKS